MFKKISNQSHWERVMDMSIAPLFNSLKSFGSSEEYKLFNRFFGGLKKEKAFFEIGAAPGFYGMVFHKYFGCIPGGIEYTDNGFRTIQKFYRNLGVNASGFVKGDFFSFKPEQKYDIVFSSGFVEHFEDYDNVMRRHIDMCCSGGYVVIMVPNYHFFYRKFQEILYRGLMTEQHVLKIMNMEAFENTVRIFEKERLVDIEHVGSLNRAGFGQLVSKNWFIQKLIHAIHLIFMKTGLYEFLPKEDSILVVIAKKL